MDGAIGITGKSNTAEFREYNALWAELGLVPEEKRKKI